MPRLLGALLGAELFGGPAGPPATAASFCEVHEHSAGYDSTLVGREGLKGLVSISTAANFMNLANAQAAKLRHTIQVTNIRASESKNVLKFLELQSGWLPRFRRGPRRRKKIPLKTMMLMRALGIKPKVILAGQFATGAGFGNGRRVALKVKVRVRGRKAPGGPVRITGVGIQRPKFDERADDIRRSLRDVIEFTDEAKKDAARLQELVADASRKTNAALGAAAEELNYPGFPPEALRRRPRPPGGRPPGGWPPGSLGWPFGGPPSGGPGPGLAGGRGRLMDFIFPRPSAGGGGAAGGSAGGSVGGVGGVGGRPTDLAPAWMDFLYSSQSSGTDPYHGLEEHNVFGSPPEPPYVAKVKMEGDGSED